MTGLTQSAYAKRRGVSVPYVNRLYHAGRLVLLADGSIDATASDAALESSRNPLRGGTGGGGIETRTIAAESGDVQKSQPETESTGTLADAKRRDAEYSAALKRLEYEREIKKLVERSRAELGATDTFGILGRSLDQLADRISARVAAETDPRRVNALLRAEFDAIRDEIANAVEALPATFKATRQ